MGARDDLHHPKIVDGAHDESIVSRQLGQRQFTAGLREEGYELMRGPPGMILDPWLSEMLEEDGSAWFEVPDDFVAGPSLAELDLRARTGVNVVAVEREGHKLLNPSPSYALRSGDRLLVLGSPDALGRLRRALAHTSQEGSPR